MILWPRADDVSESGGWYFEGQRMMFWLLLDDISIRGKWKQTLYPLYDWCKLLVFKLLLVDSRPLNPLWSLYRTPYFDAFSSFFLKKPFKLNALLLMGGKVASKVWKPCFQWVEGRFPMGGRKPLDNRTNKMAFLLSILHSFSLFLLKVRGNVLRIEKIDYLCKKYKCPSILILYLC